MTEKTAAPVHSRGQLRRQQPRWVRSLLKSRMPMVACGILITLFIAAVAAPLLAPHDPNELVVQDRLLPPVWVRGNADHLLGTDGLGRDELSRLIYGSRVTLVVGILSVIVAAILGISLGIVGGYLGGKLDTVIQRFGDIQLSFPFILLAISILAILRARQGDGGSSQGIGVLAPLIVTLGLTQWVTYARVARSMTLLIRESEYVEAARVIGVGTPSILLRAVLPNALAPLVVLASFNVASTILAEASLSFLGLGVPPSVPTWGGMLSESRELLLIGAWSLATIPGLAIVLTVLAINILGDWLRDYLDPRLAT